MWFRAHFHLVSAL